MVSLFGTAESSPYKRLPIWENTLLVLFCEASFVIAALCNAPNLRTALSVGCVCLAASIVPATIWRRPELRSIATDVADKSITSDTIVLVASCVVWRGQTPFEDIAIRVFRIGGTVAAVLGALGSIVLSWWLESHASVPQWLVSITLWVGAIAQLFLASVLFPRLPLVQLACATPIYFLAGYSQQLLLGISLKPDPEIEAGTKEPASQAAADKTK